MKTISVSTEVFAAIWRLRQNGEDSEDDVLRRLILEKPQEARPFVSQLSRVSFSENSQEFGYIDPRSGTQFPAGFTIFRTYRGIAYTARAVCGFWVLANDAQGYSSLNQLSKAIGVLSENAWENWYFKDETGKRMLISGLRLRGSKGA